MRVLSLFDGIATAAAYADNPTEAEQMTLGSAT